MYVKTGTYNGNGSSQSITGIGFQPDLVIVKAQETSASAFHKSTPMGGNNSMTLRDDSGFETTAITSLDADGFSVGGHASANENGRTFVYLAVKDDGSGDFKVGMYTGNGVNGRAITGVGFQPDMVCIKGNGGRTGSYRNEDVAGDNSHAFYFTGYNNNQIESLDADGFTLGDSDFVNANGRDYYYFAFLEVDGQAQTFTYTGNGVDNTTVNIPGTAFTPTFVWIKHQTNSDPRFRVTGHDANESQSFDGAVGTNAIQNMGSGTIEVGNDSQVNQNTDTYHVVIALKERLPSAGSPPGRRKVGVAIGSPLNF